MPRANIDNCRIHASIQDEIASRNALIRALSGNDAAEETLALVKLYESIHADANTICELLQRTSTRCPNHQLILLELRLYLRKTQKLPELAIVLEKLARITHDLQIKKSLLIEACETHEKLGNHNISQALFHEAQLCSPINPNENSNFISEKLRASPRALQSVKPKPLITSRAHTIIEDLSATTQTSRQHPQLIDDQISQARLRGNTQTLLDSLIQSIEGLSDDKLPPRILQEIGCITLYDKHDTAAAQHYLEKASKLSSDIANGEQTLNALEIIYKSQNLFPQLAAIYEKKIQILTSSNERRKYEIQLAKLNFERLGKTTQAITSLLDIIKNSPSCEPAYQLLATCYSETQQPEKAILILEKLQPKLPDNSQKLARHMLHLTTLYLDTNQIQKAKNTILNMLENNDYTDKLALIEYYKNICRDYDQWKDLLSTLKIELAIYLNIPKQSFDWNIIIKKSNQNNININHILREYADISYYKLKDTQTAAKLFSYLSSCLPDDEYSKNMISEIQNNHPGIDLF